MSLSSFTPQQTNDPLMQRIQADLKKTIDDIVRVLNALGPTITPGTSTAPGGTVNLLGLPQPGANGGIATLDGTGHVPANQIAASSIPDLSAIYQILSLKDAASGYAGLDSNSRLKSSEWPWLAGGLSFKDTAGTLAVNGTVGNIALSVGFGTGTSTGDYIITSNINFADTNWILVGSARGAAGTQGLVVDPNWDNPSHTVNSMRIYVDIPGTGLVRPSECLIFAIGNR